jgi:O-acetyl-ADP-ribose deacetylase (regulator of RNase III)
MAWADTVIKYINGDLLKSDAEAIVNAVNCVGAVGRGIALKFKKSFPDNFDFYKAACKNGEVELGKMLTCHAGGLSNPKYVINFPTKYHWRDASRIEDIQEGLRDLARVLKSRRIRSVALSPLGCGLGGLNWDEVKPLMAAELSLLPEVDVSVHEPARLPPKRRRAFMAFLK